MADEVNYEYDDELELLGPLILDDLPDFRKITDNIGTEEILVGDEELSQALGPIEEAQNDQDNTGTVADDVNQPKAQISRLAQLDDDQKEKIVMESQSHATKRQPTYGVSIFRRRCQI
jgi:hypothetical protein